MKYLASYLFYSLTFVCIVSCTRNNNQLTTSGNENTAPPDEAYLQDWERTKDPSLGRPAPERLIPVLEQIKLHRQRKTAPGDETAPWVERGPYDVGGRTRAMMFDPNDPSNKKVWAGGVTGGLWYNDDITSSASEWQNVDDFWDNIAITCIDSDPNNSNIFYVGTGESFTGASRGAGIWKSTDGGQTWSQIASTSGFYYVNDLVVRNESGSSVVYAGITDRYYEGSWHGSAQAGLQKSNNGGSSWVQVLPDIPGYPTPPSASDIELDANNDLWIGTDVSPYGYWNGVQMTDRGGGRIYKSSNGTTFSLLYTANTGLHNGRVELACAPSNAAYTYAIIEDSSVVEEIIRTTNGGSIWNNINEPNDADNGIPAADFTRGQAYYDLIAAVHPDDENQVIVGGIDLFQTMDGGTTWNQISKWSNNNNLASLSCAMVHADQHQIVYRPGASNEVIFGNDGGVYYSSDISSAASANAIQQRNNGYNVTQFYATAIHPQEGSNFYLAGSQDNGTQLFNKFGMGGTIEATGGDGAFCFIDQNEPDTVITSYVYNNYYVSYDGGQNFSILLSNDNGSFINPAAYDSRHNVLFSAYNSSSIVQLTIGGSAFPFNLALGNLASAFTVSPHTTSSSTIFIGTEQSGKLLKVTDAESSTMTYTDITGSSFSGSISSIAIGGSEDTLAVTFFNYGVTSVWYTTDGGSTWVSKEGDLPDMPVRWFVFNPNDIDEAIVATELGVWSTNNFQAPSPNWVPSNSGLANVRVDMLQMRESDKQVIAATHGRGLYSNDAFGDKSPLADFAANTERASIEMPVKFIDQSSANPNSWAWSFNPKNVVYLEGTNASSQNPVVQFTQPGSYEVSLTSANAMGSDQETKSNYISVVSATGIPYSQNFDSFSLCPVVGACGEVCTLSEGWLNANTDNGDWITFAGSTGSAGTGPSGDHTSGSGNYLYTEASNCFNKEMSLYSPVFDLSNAENPSLHFTYHMYGISIDEMEVAVYNQGEWEIIWEAQGDGGDTWNTEIIDLSRFTGKQVLFKITGTTGSSFTSDIAIDDFVISENIIRWDGGGITNNWSEADNWSTNLVPGEGSHVILDNTFVSGSYSINLTSARTIGSITLNVNTNSVSLTGGNSLNITSVIYPENGTLISNGQLTLKAISEIQYGQVAPGNGSISGNVVNEWYYDGRSGYRHISSPVSSNLDEIIGDFSRLVFSQNSDGSIWGWDPTISDWKVPAGGTDPFDEAFSVFMGNSYGEIFSPIPFVFDAEGPLNNGSQSQEMIYSVGDPAAFVDPSENAGWNFFYNPYPSVLDWNDVTSEPGFPAELSTTIYFWDQSLDASGEYSSYNATTQTSINGATQKIAKGQGAWLQLSNSPTGGSAMLTLNDNMRKIDATPKPKSTLSISSKVKILASSENGENDELFFAYFPTASFGYDHKYDHLEMDNGESGFSIHYPGNQRKLAYNCLDRYRYPIPVKFQSSKGGRIELAFSVDEDFHGNKPLYLKDISTNTIHKLADGNYSFSAEEGLAYNFLLMHRKDDDRGDKPEVTVGNGQGKLVLRFKDYDSFNEVFIFDISGKLILRKDIDTHMTRSVDIELSKTGAFILYLKGADGREYSQRWSISNSMTDKHINFSLAPGGVFVPSL